MSDLWLGRYVDARTLSENVAFRVVAATEPANDKRLVVIVAAERRASEAPAARALDRLFRAHEAPPHPIIPRAILRGDHAGLPFVTLDFPACVDFDQLLHIATERGSKAPYDAADGFSITLRDAIIASAACLDPIEGQPRCLGALALANVLFAADGRHALFGFGHNVVVYDGDWRVVARGRFFQAPEVAVGGSPNAMSDFVGMVEMTRSIMAFVRVNDAIGRVILGSSFARPLEFVGLKKKGSGRRVGQDIQLARHILWFESNVMRGAPADRPPLERIIGVSDRIRELSGTVPDPSGFASHVAEILRSERPDIVGDGALLVVARDGSWFELDSARHSLSRSRIGGRLLVRLAHERITNPSSSIPADVLVTEVWPDEKMSPESGSNRLYVAVNGLRNAGLGAWLQHDSVGYRLRPTLKVALAQP